jgi:hypothetical protein
MVSVLIGHLYRYKEVFERIYYEIDKVSSYYEISHFGCFEPSYARNFGGLRHSWTDYGIGPAFTELATSGISALIVRTTRATSIFAGNLS